MSIALSVGQRVQAARKGKGWSQRELAERVGATRRSVEAWEQGVRLLQLPELAAIAEALGVSQGHLLGDPPPESPTAAQVRSLLGSVEGRDAVLDGLSLFVREFG